MQDIFGDGVPHRNNHSLFIVCFEILGVSYDASWVV